MSHTHLPLTYQREYDGENWLLAEIDFGPDDDGGQQTRWCITTDHVHASEADFGEPEADVRLWAASPYLLEACERMVRTFTCGASAAEMMAIRDAEAAIAQAKGEAP
jgi:hypothetical protein